MTFENDPLFPPHAPRRGEADAEPAPAQFTAAQPSSEELSPAALELPEDIRVPWSWGSLLLFIFLYLFSLILSGALVGAGFAVFGIRPEQIRNSANYTGLLAVIAQGLQSLLILAYLAAQTEYWFGWRPWRALGWRPLESGSATRAVVYLKYVFGGFALSMIIQLASASLQTKTHLPIEKLFQDKTNALLLLVMAVTIAPLVEETIFRGYIYPVLARSFGVRTSIIVTGTLFGLLHAVQLWGGWLQIALIILVGIIFTYVRSQTRTVVASYLVHLGYNSFPLIVFLVATRGLRNIPGGP
jgi:membrane protease YdiL (CAAX protease family)